MDEEKKATRKPKKFIVAVRLLLLPLFTLYGAALLIAAWPNGKDFGPLQPVHQASRELFDTLRTRSASYVFAGNRGRWKRRSFCFVVIGSDKDGKRRTLRSSFPNCKMPSVRVWEDTFEVFLKRTSHSPEMKRFLGKNEKRHQKELGKLRRSRRLSQIGKYFCESELVDNDGIERVDFIWQMDQIHYQTAEIDRKILHVHRFDCKTKRAIRRGRWWELAIDDEKGPQILSKEQPAKSWRYTPKKPRRRNKSKSRRRRKQLSAPPSPRATPAARTLRSKQEAAK